MVIFAYVILKVINVFRADNPAFTNVGMLCGSFVRYALYSYTAV